MRRAFVPISRLLRSGYSLWWELWSGSSGAFDRFPEEAFHMRGARDIR